MSERNPDYQFIDISVETIITQLTEKYEELTKRTVNPSSPEKLFLSWVASAIIQIYQNINYAANQNLPSRATGENLDALAQLFYLRERPAATPAYVTMEFTLSAEQSTAIIIPQGTRITTAAGDPVFETVEEAVFDIGETTVQVQARCQEAGTAGNGYEAGQINVCVDLFTYYESCANVETSGGGSDAPTDDEFYELLINSASAWSSAGPRSAYKYYAKSVSTDIADVVVTSPSPGEVVLYALMNDGTIAGSAVKGMILLACNDDEVRPLTDLVSVDDPVEVSYDITLTYYMSTESEKSAADIQQDVENAVDEYVTWQSSRLGRDINPSKLVQMIVAAGAKRVEVTSPVFTHLGDGSDNTAPEIAQIGTITLTNGGYEDE